MAKKGINNKNKVTRPGSVDPNAQGAYDATQGKLEETRRKMKTADQKEFNKLKLKEVKLAEEAYQKHDKTKEVVMDIASMYEQIASKAAEQTNSFEKMYGNQKKLAEQLGMSASYAAEIAASTRETSDLTKEDARINRQTQSDLAQINRLKLDAVQHAQKLTLFNKENIPYYDKIKGMQAEIAALAKDVGDKVQGEKFHRLETLKTMVKEYETLGKLEKKNEQIEKMQKSINDLMTLQGTAAGKVLSVLKDIVTNPLAIFTG